MRMSTISRSVRMDTSSGSSMNSFGSDSGLQNLRSKEDLELTMDPKKRKRMISNRESARRSRLRKRHHLDGLISQVAQLRKEKNQILGGLNVTTQHCISVEAENAILSAQAAELSHRLYSLNQISSVFSLGNCSLVAAEEPAYYMSESDGSVNYCCDNLSQPILMEAALADAGGFQY